MQHSKDAVSCDAPVARLYELHAPAIFAYLRRQTPSREGAEDVLVEVFAAAKVVVWNVSTRQMVFQHNNFSGGSDQPIAWQPGSYNLAFVGTINSNSVATLEIWDATTGKLVKSFGSGSGVLAWSPDGRYLAYAGYNVKNAVNVVIIIDAATGKQIYVYKGHHQSISTIAWSPNGQYIASAEGNTQGPMVAEVWTA